MHQIISFGYWIRRRRKALDLTQDELAQRVGCAVVTLRKIEADERRPSKKLAEQLAEALELGTLERHAFLKVARAERAVDQLAEPTVQLDAIIRYAVRGRQSSMLPTPLTPLIGRQREVAAVVNLLHRADVRLVTLWGTAGIGKTRLSLQVAANLRDDFPDGIFFVPLAPITDPALVISSIAQVLGVQDSRAQPLLASLKVHLHAQHLLLVLDNFEQAIEAAPCIAGLLEAAPKLNVLATSREVLRLSGEHEFAVPPLTLPDLQHVPPLPALRQTEAVQLFIERAKAILPDFVLTDETARAVAEICHRLDGLPLAIELAAVRIRLLSPQGILQRLDHRLKMLTGGARERPARHQTLRGAIDWSYNLLTADEQVLLARLGVFVGSWTLEAAAAICGAHPSQPIDILDGLESLVAKSLVRRQEAWSDGRASPPRFSMYETIREYALEQLEASGEAPAVRSRHVQFFRDLTEAAEPHVQRAEQVRWLAHLDVEHPNLRAALAWALEQGACEDGLRLATAITWFWHLRGHDREAYRWLQRLLAARPDLVPAIGARALPMAAFFAYILGEVGQAQAWGEAGVALGRATGDRRSLVHSLIMLGWAEPEEQQRIAWMDEALDTARQLGDPWWIAMALWYKSEIYRHRDDDQAQTLLETSLPLFRRIGDAWSVGWNLSELGEVVYRRGHYERAAALFEESLTWLHTIGHNAGIAVALLGFGKVACDQGEHAQAAALLDEGLARFREAGHPAGIADVLCARGKVALAQGDVEYASSVLEEGLAIAQAFDTRSVSAALYLLGRVALARGNLARARTLLTESLQRRRGGSAADLLESLEGLAALAAVEAHGSEGHLPSTVHAVRVLGAVAAARTALNVPQPPSDRVASEGDVAVVRETLPAATWEAAWAAGQALTLEQATAYALDHHPMATEPTSMRSTAGDADLAATTMANSSNAGRA